MMNTRFRYLDLRCQFIYYYQLLYTALGSTIEKFLGIWNGITEGDRKGGTIFCYRITDNVFGTYVLSGKGAVQIRQRFTVDGTEIRPNRKKSSIKGTYTENETIVWTMNTRISSIWLRCGSYVIII